METANRLSFPFYINLKHFVSCCWYAAVTFCQGAGAPGVAGTLRVSQTAASLRTLLSSSESSGSPDPAAWLRSSLV